MRAFYFGCRAPRDLGHYMFNSEMRNEPAFTYSNPWGTKVDGGLAPKGAQTEGVGLIHRKDGWTALSFWDRSVDHRQGSCSVFLADGTYAFEEMVRIAGEVFPNVVKRFTFKITNGESP